MHENYIYVYTLQVAERYDDISNLNDQEECELSTSIHVHSTERPTSLQLTKATKQQKKEQHEGQLIEKALDSLTLSLSLSLSLCIP